MRKRIFYGWYIVAGSVAMNFYLSVVFFQGFQVFFLPILNEFGWTRALTSGAFSLRQLESGLLAPVIGFLVDRWGPRVIILLGVIIGGAGMVGMAYINSVWSFYVVFMVASFGVSGASHGVSWSVAVANWFNRLRGRALGIAMLGPVVGGPFVVSVAVLEAWLGWRVSMLLLGVGVWIVGIPLSLLARSFPEKYGYLPDGDTRGGANDDDYEDENFEGIGVKEAVRTRNFWVITVLFGAQFIGISGLFVHLIPMLQDLNYSASQAAGILGLLFLLSGIGRIGAGTLADTVDYRLVMSVLIVFQLVALMLLTLVSGPSDFWLVVLYSFLFGVGFRRRDSPAAVLNHANLRLAVFRSPSGTGAGRRYRRGYGRTRILRLDIRFKGVLQHRHLRHHRDHNAGAAPPVPPPETEAGGKMVHRGGRTLISVRRMARNKTLNNLG